MGEYKMANNQEFKEKQSFEEAIKNAEENQPAQGSYRGAWQMAG